MHVRQHCHNLAVTCNRPVMQQAHIMQSVHGRAHADGRPADWNCAVQCMNGRQLAALLSSEPLQGVLEAMGAKKVPFTPHAGIAVGTAVLSVFSWLLAYNPALIAEEVVTKRALTTGPDSASVQCRCSM